MKVPGWAIGLGNGLGNPGEPLGNRLGNALGNGGDTLGNRLDVGLGGPGTGGAGTETRMLGNTMVMSAQPAHPVGNRLPNRGLGLGNRLPNRLPNQGPQLPNGLPNGLGNPGSVLGNRIGQWNALLDA